MPLQPPANDRLVKTVETMRKPYSLHQTQLEICRRTRLSMNVVSVYATAWIVDRLVEIERKREAGSDLQPEEQQLLDELRAQHDAAGRGQSFGYECRWPRLSQTIPPGDFAR